MMMRQLTGLAMIGVEATLLYRTMGYLPVALLALLMASIGCWPRMKWNGSVRRKFFAALVVVACYWIWWRLDLRDMQPSRSAQFTDNFGLAASLALMMVQALQYYWKDPRGLPNHYPFLGALSMAFASDHYITVQSERSLVFGLIMGFGMLIAFYYSIDTKTAAAGQRRYHGYRLSLLGCCLLLSFLLATGTAWVLGNSERAVGQWLANQQFVRNQLVLGNQSTARLNSMSRIKAHNFDRIALQIIADESPGYLRGQVYDEYYGDSWTAVGMGNAADNPEEIPSGYEPEWGDESLYVVGVEADAVASEMVVYPDDRIDQAIFTPQGTGWVGTQFGYVVVNDALVVQASTELLGRPYHVLSSVEPPVSPLTPEEREDYLALPSDLSADLHTLAEEVAGDQETVLGKANAITQYFTSNYDYELGIEVPNNTAAMRYFLFSDPLPNGHCEFFATGAALLLRASGVPARYVTGVGVWEQHPFADFWVVRNRDAHAWVEAWDPEEGWFIVEATPANGLPVNAGEEITGGVRDFWKMLSLTVRRFISAVKEGSWATFKEVLRDAVWGLIGFLQWAWWFVVSVGLVLFLLWEIRQRWRKGGRRRGGTQDGVQLQLQQQLSGMDRWVYKRLQLRRSVDTTAHAFARMLEEADDEDGTRRLLAQWYRQWGMLRYRSTPKPEEIAALGAQRSAVEKQAKSPKASS